MSDITYKWNAKELTTKNKEQGYKGLLNGGEIILDASNQDAPLDDGTLIATGNVTGDEHNLEVIISYDTQYAIRQHEDTTIKHKNGRKAKFLENAAKSNQQLVLDAIAAALRESFK